MIANEWRTTSLAHRRKRRCAPIDPIGDSSVHGAGRTATFDAQTVGRRLAAIMLGKPCATETVPLSGTLMQDLAGTYDDGGRTVTLAAKDGILSYQRDGGRIFPLQMMGDGTLHFTPDDLSYFHTASRCRGSGDGVRVSRSRRGACEAHPPPLLILLVVVDFCSGWLSPQ